jgi:hypothetical protein
MISINVCRVCGKIQCEPPWGEDGISPNYTFCDCCGVEFGYGDCWLIAIHSSRKRWLDQGAKWDNPKERPVDWDLEEQLKQIPEQFK